MSAERDSVRKILIVATALCVVCSVVVSSVAVGLKDRQEVNSKLDEKRNILYAAGLLAPGASGDVDALFKNISTYVVDLDTGLPVAVDAKTFDPRAAAKDPKQSTAVPEEFRGIGLRERAKRALVYIEWAKDKPRTVILPIHGKGLWSTMYGFLALAPDLRTVKGIKYYEHGETPGLGGEVDNPNWLSQWPGKTVYDADGSYHFKLLKGKHNTQSKFEADGITGATFTCRGVDWTLRYWLSASGYGPFLASVKAGRIPRVPPTTEPGN